MTNRIMPEQVIGGTQGHFLTVAIFRSWRGLAGSAAPGLPGHWKHTRDKKRCQSIRGIVELVGRMMEAGRLILECRGIKT